MEIRDVKLIVDSDIYNNELLIEIFNLNNDDRDKLLYLCKKALILTEINDLRVRMNNDLRVRMNNDNEIEHSLSALSQRIDNIL